VSLFSLSQNSPWSSLAFHHLLNIWSMRFVFENNSTRNWIVRKIMICTRLCWCIFYEWHLCASYCAPLGSDWNFEVLTSFWDCVFGSFILLWNWNSIEIALLKSLETPVHNLKNDRIVSCLGVWSIPLARGGGLTSLPRDQVVCYILL
jgi:hypothetical protein